MNNLLKTIAHTLLTLADRLENRKSSPVGCTDKAISDFKNHNKVGGITKIAGVTLDEEE